MGGMLRYFPLCPVPGPTPAYSRLMTLQAHASFLQVPLDYTHPNGSTAAVALLRVPSALSPQDKRYRGPILLNPGGPGGSGVDTVVSLGTIFQQLVGDEYDVVGFDPRLAILPHPSLLSHH
jgi:pimeloyl-ACP methyl ester carboxylesterase